MDNFGAQLKKNSLHITMDKIFFINFVEVVLI